MAIRDNIAGGKAILEATERVKEFTVDQSIEAVLIKPPEAEKGPRGRRRWWNVRGERVCRRSAGGRPEVYQVREPTTTTNARTKVLFTHCGLKVHSHYSV